MRFRNSNHNLFIFMFCDIFNRARAIWSIKSAVFEDNHFSQRYMQITIVLSSGKNYPCLENNLFLKKLSRVDFMHIFLYYYYYTNNKICNI